MVIEYSMSMQQKITAQLIIEIAGFPKEHIEDVLDKLVENIKEEEFVVEDLSREMTCYENELYAVKKKSI